MQAVICKEYGPPEKLVIENIDLPSPKNNEVRIRVEACGVNFPDTLIIQNKYQIQPKLPFSPGGEISGVIDAKGKLVKGFDVGDQVIAIMPYGGFAEYVVAPETALLRTPMNMDGIKAAGFAMTYGTSMHALKQRANLQKGETLLVLGAGGGVGLAAVQIGKAIGAKVIAGASTNQKIDSALNSGADEIINYSQDDLRERINTFTLGKGIDVVFDAAGGPLFEKALRSISWNGRVLVIGFASGDIPKISMNLPLLKGCSIVGVFWGAFRQKQINDDNKNFDELFELYKEDKIKPIVSKEFSLKNVSDALNTLLNRQVIGKIVLKP